MYTSYNKKLKVSIPIKVYKLELTIRSYCNKY